MELRVYRDLRLFEEVDSSANVKDLIFDGVFEVQFTKQSWNQFVKLHISMFWFYDLILYYLPNMPVVVSVFEFAGDDLALFVGFEMQEPICIRIKALVYHLNSKKKLTILIIKMRELSPHPPLSISPSQIV